MDDVVGSQGAVGGGGSCYSKRGGKEHSGFRVVAFGSQRSEEKPCACGVGRDDVNAALSRWVKWVKVGVRKRGAQ